MRVRTPAGTAARRLLVAIFLVLLSWSLAAAASSVWRARKGGEVIYLGGTFHLLRQVDYPLPTEFERAFDSSDLILFETDIAKLQEPATRSRLLARAIYENGDTIDRHLSPATYATLKEQCAANSIPLESMRRMRPSFLILTLTMMELQRLGVTEEGVDQHFHSRAVKGKKMIGALETVEEQLDFLVTMADGNEDQFVRHSLRELKGAREEFGRLAGAWRSGDAAGLEELLTGRMKREQPILYRRLISERNRAWLPGIVARRKPGQTSFVLVGAAHLVGEDGLIEALKKMGYGVEKLNIPDEKTGSQKTREGL